MRFTNRYSNGKAFIMNCALQTTNGIEDVIEKLAQYEDTGLTPQEIKQMKSNGVQDIFEWLEQKCKDRKKEVDRLAELCRGSWGFYRDSYELLKAQERLQAYVEIKIGVEKYMKKLRYQGE